MSEEYDDDFVDDLDSTKAPSPTVPKEPLQSQPKLEVPSSSNQPTELPPPNSAKPNMSPVPMTETPIDSEPTPLITPSPNGESASTIAPATSLQPPDQPKELNSHDQALPSTFVEESRVATHETQTDGAWEPRIVESEDTIVIGGARYRVSTAQRWSSKGVSRTTTGRVGSAGTAQKMSHAPSYIANELRKIELIRPASASSQQQQSVPRAAVGLGSGKRHPSPPATTMASYADKIVKAPSKEIISLSAFGEKSVCAAACTGDVEAMAKLVAQQVSLTGADAYSIVNTAGYVTIDRNRYGLKRVGASYTVGIGGKATPLQYACALGQTAAVKYLIDNGAVDSAVLGGAANGSAHSALPKPSLIAEANGFTAMKLLFKAPEKKKRTRIVKSNAADISAVAPQGDGVAERSLIGGEGQAVLGLGDSSNIAVPVVVEHVAELTSAVPIVTSSAAASTLPSEFTPVVDTPVVDTPVVDTPIASTTAAVAPSTEVAPPPLPPQSSLIEASAPPPAITQAPAAPISVPAASKDVVSSSSESFESDSS